MKRVLLAVSFAFAASHVMAEDHAGECVVGAEKSMKSDAECKKAAEQQKASHCKEGVKEFKYTFEKKEMSVPCAAADTKTSAPAATKTPNK